MDKPHYIRHSINFSSGELLVTDWFKIYEFNNRVNSIKKDVLNSPEYAVQNSEYYIRKCGFVSVYVENTKPSLIRVGDGLIVGEIDHDDPRHVGSIQTDLWWASLIDRERLVQILSIPLGVPEAKDVIQRYVTFNNVMRVRIPPGDYHVTYCATSTEFRHCIDPETDVGSIVPYFMITKVPS
jgi:hypothetical protein